MNAIYRNIIYSISTLFLACIAMYLYTTSLIDDLEYYNKYDLQDGIFVSTIELIIYIGFSTLFLKKILLKNWKILLSTFLYLIVLQGLLFNLAFSVRAEFGTTWTTMEVLLELVLNYKKTILLLSVSTIVYYILLKILVKYN